MCEGRGLLRWCLLSCGDVDRQSGHVLGPAATHLRGSPRCTSAKLTAAPSLEAQCRASGQEGYYRLQMKSGGKYLDAVNCSEQVALNGGSAYAGGVCQLWRMVPAGGGWSRLQLKEGGKYLDAANCSDHVALNGGSTFADGACQLWRLVPAGGGWSRLEVKQGGKYLEAASMLDKVGLNTVSTYAQGACQLWRLVGASP